MTTASEMQDKVVKWYGDVDRQEKFINGTSDETVQLRDGRVLKTMAKLEAEAQIEIDEATEAAQRAINAAATVTGVVADGRVLDGREFELSGFTQTKSTSDNFAFVADYAPTYSPPEDPLAPFAPKAKAVGVGTSLIEQGITPKIAAALSAQNRLGVLLPTANLGRSGATSLSVILNFEAAKILYQPVGKVIPGEKQAILLTPAVAGPLEGYGGASGSAVGILAGVVGLFEWDSAAQTMKFTREVAGAPVGVPYPVAYAPMMYDRDSLYAYNNAGAKQRKTVEDARDCFAVFWAMRNDIFDQPSNLFYADLAIRRYESLIARMRPRTGSGFVILTEIPSTLERDPNSPSRQHIDAMNRAILARWPRNAVDITTPFLAADNPAGSLFNDGYLHPNGAGQDIIAGVVADFIMANKLLVDVSA